jgi:L-rhamnose mutarotase
MQSIGLALQLRPNCYEEYKRRHDNLWPELAAELHTNGISMIIFRFGDHLFIHEAFPSAEALARMNQHPVAARWNVAMAEVLETDESGKIIFHQLPKAFVFGNFE